MITDIITEITVVSIMCSLKYFVYCTCGNNNFKLKRLSVDVTVCALSSVVWKLKWYCRKSLKQMIIYFKYELINYFNNFLIKEVSKGVINITVKSVSVLNQVQKYIFWKHC